MIFTVNTSAARHVRKVLDVVCRGRETWQADNYASSKKADVYWMVLDEDQYERAQKLKKSERMARIPGMHHLCDKTTFSQLMEAHDVDFFPKTYIVSEGNWGSIPKSAWKTPKIFKPDEGGGGDGIYLLFSQKDLDRRMELTKARTAVVQEYIPSPFLLDGFKWDMRIYVLVLSLRPLRVFLCREGLARFSSEPYEKATARTAHKVGAHLTNYSISKYSQGYVHSDDPLDGTKGCKRSLSATMEYLAECGHDTEAIWEEIRDLVATSAQAMGDELLGEGVGGLDLWPPSDACPTGSAELPGKHSETNCFQVLGFDIMLDSECKPWILEVNSNPSLAIDSVYPTTGSAAMAPPPLPTDVPYAEVMQRAWDVMTLEGRTANKTCTCMSHHRPHIHSPCAVDVVVKSACVGDALLLVKRDMRAQKNGEEVDDEDIVKGTSYECVV